MTALPPDPDPAKDPHVETGVEPGETPPESPQTSATSNPDPPARRTLTARPVVAIVAIAVLVLIFAAVGVLLVGRIFGLFG